MSGTATKSQRKSDITDLQGLSRSGIHYLNESKRDQILRSDIALDKDGVFAKDHVLLNYCRRLAFSAFGEEFSDQERARRGMEYKIDENVGGILATIKGYNTGAPPVEAVMAVNRLVRDNNPDHKGISFRGLTQAQAFAKIFSFTNSAEILDALRIRYLRDSDTQLAQRMFEWYDKNIYRHPTGAKFMVEVPGSTSAVMHLYRHLLRMDGRLSVVTDTPDQDTFDRHLSAVGFTNEMIRELREGLLVITQADVKNRKPDPEGLHRVKRPAKSLLYVGDTVRDGEAVIRARKEGKNPTPDVEFCAVLSGGSARHALEAYNPAVIANDIEALARQMFRA